MKRSLDSGFIAWCQHQLKNRAEQNKQIVNQTPKLSGGSQSPKEEKDGKKFNQCLM